MSIVRPAPVLDEAPYQRPAPVSDPLTSHEYDGIREYDNPTPGWWHLIFLGSIVFSIFYFLFWHGSPVAWTIQEAWADDQKAEFAKIFGTVGELKHDEDTVIKQMSNDKFMAIAKATFQGNCAACHARDGGGLPGSGVNLCDDSYKNIERIGDFFKVITEGANNGAMPSWKAKLSDNERVILAAYVASLRGTTPVNPKSPEGKPIPPWPKIGGATASDSQAPAPTSAPKAP